MPTTPEPRGNPTPATDCPPCPECGRRVGTPMREVGDLNHRAPEGSTLFCPACGHGWVGTKADVALAEWSWKQWMKEESR